MSARGAKAVRHTAALVPLLLWTVLLLVPLIITVGIALKTRYDLLVNPIGWPQPVAWGNIGTAWQEGDLGTALMNSVIITTCGVLGLIALGASAAYPLARRVGRWPTGIYVYFILGLIVPLQLGLVPLYRAWQWLGLVDSQAGVVLIQIGELLPLTIFLFTGFIKTVPRELEEAAAIDGASQFRTFWTIVFPLLRPVTATVIIVTSLVIWNDFLIPLLFLQQPDLQTIPLAIYGFVGEYSQSWNLIFASIVVSSLPIIALFLILQRSFIKGLTGGALKG
ncbi:MAG TPA: carbohydrate ABC transporter permease [Ktedonobacterales bacterium]|nr:carbohydrate ABC transporter permease [Ktedonobacterales bacterium]